MSLCVSQRKICCEIPWLVEVVSQMDMNKAEKQRSYHPEFVSQATLSYLLDCSQSTLDSYVERGILPAPMKIGNLKRLVVAGCGESGCKQWVFEHE